MKRRNLILSGLGITGALVVGWGVMPERSRLGKPSNMLLTEGDIALNGWIKIAKDGSVVLAMHRSEMGQGIHNALSMLVAEELDVPLSQIRLEQAGHDSIYGNVAMFVGTLPFHPLQSEGVDKPFVVHSGEWIVGKVARELGVNATGGSSSVKDAWSHLRLAAATAKASLLLAAASQWKVPLNEIKVKEGLLTHASGKSANYGEFAKAAAGQTPQNVAPKDRKDWTLIGKPSKRADVPSKTNGTAIFGMDVRLPNMLFASVVQVPQMGGTMVNFDAKEALAMPGVVKFVELASKAGSAPGFAVVAKSTWHAKQAADKVKAQWAQRAEGAIDTQGIEAQLIEKLKTEKGYAFHDQGNADKAESSATRIIQAQYKAPYLAHATMEPMNCTAQFKGGLLEIWAPTQVPGLARAAAAKVADVSEDKVKLNVTLLGGGFGRRLEADVVAQATQIAMALDGAPVQLVWTREEDMTHDFYRPMHVAQLSAAINAKGEVESLRIKSAGDAISPRWMSRVLPALSGPIDAPDKTTAEGLFDLPYGFANQHMAHVSTRMGVPIGFWRSVGHSHNAFFSESFIDELAFETKQDPVAFRLSLLTQTPRYAAVLKMAADKAKWGATLPSGHAHGVALHKSFGSIVAQVAEVSMKEGVLRVHRVVCAIDCGTVVNPDTVAQQVESSVSFALSAAMFGKIDIQEGVVQQTNFTNYPLVNLAQSPVVETWIMPSTQLPEGVGEPSVPPLAPAVANAMFKLMGKRVRSLPLKA
ncbi:xanthine dehydrogenase family protein molybdopterin-binding subunit [Limnohabitans sp. MMS-10A-178]|uniref:xanthine dehydrogenase family protein molybdopterin-binding subunit n=1 Tax=Limnohabitans sp. MMS-10A-178 TaxID=1835767 RepID=UPI000D3CE553|nr:molybdopterin cofactor-binding domain-containing protein [Limnohabitans sp. MMS-10A-178]PUE16774.1 acylaldehyde oxidase [Limnohabitans sp. MMS-10A-178]